VASHKREHVIVASLSGQCFHTWGKREKGGDKLPPGQWIIRNPETVAHNIIDNIHEQSHRRTYWHM